jgi:hypothetical protein
VNPLLTEPTAYSCIVVTFVIAQVIGMKLDHVHLIVRIKFYILIRISFLIYPNLFEINDTNQFYFVI